MLSTLDMNLHSLLRIILMPAMLVSIICKAHALESDWIDPARIMVIYNTVKMDSVDPTESATFSRDMGKWYMLRYGMPTKHLFGYDMGTRVKWNNPGAFDFLKAVADYIENNDIQVVLLAPGTPLLVRDTNNNANLALDSLAGHALWFAKVRKEAPACNNRKSIAKNNSNLYFPYTDMKDGASPFVARTNNAHRWCPDRGSLEGKRYWYDTMMVDLRDHPSVRPYGRIGLPYYLEAFPDKEKGMSIPTENTQFVKDLVNGGIAATTSIKDFNAQSKRSLLFYGRENSSASFIDVKPSLYEAMAQDAIVQGISANRIVRVHPRGGKWNNNSCLQEPSWNYSHRAFRNGLIKPAINPLIFSAGGVGNTTEAMEPWPDSLQVQPGLVATAATSNGSAFAGSLLKRGATTIIVNIKHPRNSRLHAWFSVFRQLVNGATVAEAMVAGGGSERGGYITGSIWGDPLYAPFGKNPHREDWFTGGRIPPVMPANFVVSTSTHRQIRLSWAPAHLAAGYRLERRRDNGIFTPLVDLLPTRTTYNDRSVTTESRYEYRMRAYNTAGASDWSVLRATTTIEDTGSQTGKKIK
jgi:hypothetical protein